MTQRASAEPLEAEDVYQEASAFLVFAYTICWVSTEEDPTPISHTLTSKSSTRSSPFLEARVVPTLLEEHYNPGIDPSKRHLPNDHHLFTSPLGLLVSDDKTNTHAHSFLLGGTDTIHARSITVSLPFNDEKYAETVLTLFSTKPYPQFVPYVMDAIQTAKTLPELSLIASNMWCDLTPLTVPLRGQSTALSPTISITTPSRGAFPDTDFHIGEGLRPLLAAFPPRVIVSLLAALLREEQVLLIGADVGPLAAAATALRSLLFPLPYPHLFVPLLPLPLARFLMAPVPYLIGMPSRAAKCYPGGIKQLQRLLVADMQTGGLTDQHGIPVALEAPAGTLQRHLREQEQRLGPPPPGRRPCLCHRVDGAPGIPWSRVPLPPVIVSSLLGTLLRHGNVFYPRWADIAVPRDLTAALRAQTASRLPLRGLMLEDPSRTQTAIHNSEVAYGIPETELTDTSTRSLRFRPHELRTGISCALGSLLDGFEVFILPAASRTKGPPPSLEEMFDRPAFLEQLSVDLRPFAEHLCRSQLFGQLLPRIERTRSGNHLDPGRFGPGWQLRAEWEMQRQLNRAKTLHVLSACHIRSPLLKQGRFGARAVRERLFECRDDTIQYFREGDRSKSARGSIRLSSLLAIILPTSAHPYRLHHRPEECPQRSAHYYVPVSSPVRAKASPAGITARGVYPFGLRVRGRVYRLAAPTARVRRAWMECLICRAPRALAREVNDEEFRSFIGRVFVWSAEVPCEDEVDIALPFYV